MKKNRLNIRYNIFCLSISLHKLFIVINHYNINVDTCLSDAKDVETESVL